MLFIKTTLCVSALAVVCILPRLSAAKDHSRWANAPYHDWYENQLNSEGAWCCHEADAHPYFGDYSYNADGSVTLKLSGGDHMIPAELIVKTPNPTGHAVWWFSEDDHGNRVDYCFSPGALF